MYETVPMAAPVRVVARAIELSTTTASPKSEMAMLPSASIRQFPGFRSLHTMPSPCSWESPTAIWCATTAACSAGILARFESSAGSRMESSSSCSERSYRSMTRQSAESRWTQP